MIEEQAGFGPAEMAAFLAGSAGMEFHAGSRAEKYAWVEAQLTAQEYGRRKRPEKGRIRRYLEKVTGLSRAQMTRLVGQHRREGRVRGRAGRHRGFARRYTEADIARLAEVDAAHGWLSGPATCRILAREHEVYRRAGFERLAHLSVSHLYNLRAGASYRRQGRHWEKTKASGVSIAERRRPEPNGEPGHLRVDTVHQGDAPGGGKGVYHINLVDEVTQWEAVGCCPAISEVYMEPLLEVLLEELPFQIVGFHSDNGSEFINATVARLLQGRLIAFTKSRANRSNDNALVEGKNGAIIRKHMGYGHIARGHAARIDGFYRRYLNPYLNFHRPCGFATVSYNPRGKRQRRYARQDYRTPYEKLRSLPDAQRHLRTGFDWARLDALALRQSDTEAAVELNRAKRKLFDALEQAPPEGPWKSGNPPKRDSHFPTAPTTTVTFSSPKHAARAARGGT